MAIESFVSRPSGRLVSVTLIAACLAALGILIPPAEAGSLVIPAWSFARGNGRIYADPGKCADTGPVVGSGRRQAYPGHGELVRRSAAAGGMGQRHGTLVQGGQRAGSHPLGVRARSGRYPSGRILLPGGASPLGLRDDAAARGQQRAANGSVPAGPVQRRLPDLRRARAATSGASCGHRLVRQEGADLLGRDGDGASAVVVADGF